MYYYHARFYSSVLGHFMSADTSPADGLNRYAYVLNNPLKYVDPSGQCILDLPCSEQDAENWLNCAFTCGNTSAGDWSRSAVGSSGFWERVAQTWIVSGDQELFVGRLLADITRGATQPTLFSVIPSDGFEFLGSTFGVNANFFAASLNDLLFGTSWAESLDPSLFIGGSRWWSTAPIGWMKVDRGEEFPFAEGTTRSFGDRTKEIAFSIQAAGGDPNNSKLFHWSVSQRDVLSGVPSLHVDAAREYPTLGGVGIDCALDSSCLTKLAKYANRLGGVRSPVEDSEEPTDLIP